ncbi:MAG: hypothetical protein JNL80_14195 [Phycisphaerae bacterium]|jgi:hypothetical protein|nr:hypothetical protein [Phycisphaerae bacterium]
MNATPAPTFPRLVRSLAVMTAVALGGCYSPSPHLFNTSTDTFTYESTTMRPITITVIDVRTEEPFFRMEVPVGKQLSFDFEESGGDDPVLRPAKMSWSMWDAGKRFGSLTNSLSVPDKTCRRIEYTLRNAPEYAPQPPQAEMRVGDASSKPEWATEAGGPPPAPTSSRLYE